MSKEGFNYGFIDENGKYIDIPKNIQEHIEEREKYWFKKMKEIDDKCGILLEKLALTEKALELACKELNRIEAKFGSAYIRANGYLVDYFKTKAKEMKSE